MSDIKSSPNDPIFYLHHCNVDRWWFRWQRIRDTSFNDYTAGAQGLSTKLTFFNTPVSSVMDASGSLCYTYSSSWETNVNFNGYQCPGVGGAVLLNENAAGLVIAGNGSINTTGGGGSNNNSTASSTGATNTNSSISLLNGTTPGVNVSSVLTNPPPLPQSFLDQHGMNATQVAIVEGNLNQLSGVNINNLFSGSGSGDVSNRSSSSQSTGSKTSGSLPMVKSASTSITAAAAAAAALFMAVVVDLIL